jgi:hypothetical protein
MVDWVVVRSPAATLYACAGRTPAPPIPKDMGWFARLALDEADAIQLLAPGDEDEELRGLFDPSPTNPGLALVLEEERQLAGFGNPASLSRLRAHLIRGESIMFHEVTIEAIPSGAPTLKTASGRGWVIARPTYRFLVFER